MNKVFVGAILLCFSILSLFIGSSVSAKNGDVCTGNYSYATLGDLVVPAGQTCQLNQFNVVSGDLRVEKGASLVVCPDNEITGNVKAHNPNTIYITDLVGGPCSAPKARGITIGGDIHIAGGQSVHLLGNSYGGIAVIKGSVKVENAVSVAIQNFNNLSSILGDVKLEHNGYVTVTDNIIGGDLKIHATSGSCIEQNNSVSGSVNSCP